MDVQVCNIYAPNASSDKKVFFNTLCNYVCGSKPAILAGDFNCVPDSNLDRMGSSSSQTPELNTFVSMHKMLDVWRIRNPGVSDFTWHKPDGSDASRLDRIYTALTTKSWVIPCQITQKMKINTPPSQKLFKLCVCNVYHCNKPNF